MFSYYISISISIKGICELCFSLFTFRLLRLCQNFIIKLARHFLMDTLVSTEWPLLNPDFDEGSIMADFDCEDFSSLTNPACSPNSGFSNANPDEIMNGKNNVSLTVI